MEVFLQATDNSRNSYYQGIFIKDAEGLKLRFQNST